KLGPPGSSFVGRWYCHICWRRMVHKIPSLSKPASAESGEIEAKAVPLPGHLLPSDFSFLPPSERRLCRDCHLPAPLGLALQSAAGSRGDVDVAVAAQSCEEEPDWVCPMCFLRCPRAPDPHQDLARTDFGFEGLQQVMLLRAAAWAARRSEPEPSSKNSGPPAKIGDQPWAHGCIDVLWDAGGRNAAALARALHDEFGAFLQMLARHPEVPREEVVRERGLSALLPGGIYINGCEVNPKVLFYELKYLLTVAPPDPLELARVEVDVMARLSALRQQWRPKHAEDCRWWKSSEVFAVISRSLAEHKSCIIDGFLQPEEVAALQDTACQLRSGEHLERGIVEQRHGDRSFFGEECDNQGDFLNIADQPNKWTVQGDHRIWIKDTDARAQKLRLLTSALDDLVTSMRRDKSVDPQTASRLRRISFRENTMVACYHGKSRGRYMKHCDTGRKAVLTAIIYLNSDWQPDHGGHLRLFQETSKCPTRVRCDVAPVANRLLLFWATDECPHEVLAARSDRFAMTTWFLDGRQHLGSGGQSGLQNLLNNANVVESQSDDEAVECRKIDEQLRPDAVPGHCAVDSELLRTELN
ncbi:unnamed protein product, partial [Polarella glacialis]